jgi:hypothetical protein
MSSYFLMTGVASGKWATLYAPDEYDEFELWDLIEVLRKEEEWIPLKVKTDGKALNDMPSCDILGRICSPKLMEVLKPFVEDQVLWLPVSIDTQDETVCYYFMHYLECPNALDDSCKGQFQKPIIDSQKAKEYKIFSQTPTSVSMLVHENVKNAVKQSGCTGITFEALEVS